MQQNSQIVELYKDRLVQALDDQYNVRDLDEVKQIITGLERTHVTREDLEKTRLGKFINELRRKTTDKDLAKRAKKLIKTWQNLTVGPNVVSVHSNSTTPNAALTSPFAANNSINISPHSLSNDSFPAYSYANNNISSSYAPGSTVNGINANGHGRNGGGGDSKSLNAAAAANGNSHPALWRIRNSTNEKSRSGQLVSPFASSSGKPNAFRQTASPRELSSSSQPLNGHHHLQQLQHHRSKQSPSLISQRQRSHSNLTSPVNNNLFSSQNGLSPGLRNSFKNILSRDGGISPSNAAYVRRTTPPTPGGNVSLTGSDHSSPSSKHCSPLAFNFSNDSHDSTSFRNHRQNHHHAPAYDEDSNSSVFSDHSSVDGPIDGNRSLLDPLGEHNRKPHGGRKRKGESENDPLRDNVNSIKNSGARRPQSTQELMQKFKFKLGAAFAANKNDVVANNFTSLSASSSPQSGHIIGKDELDSMAVPAKRTKYSNGYTNGFHSSLRNDDDGVFPSKSAILMSNKSLPASPALQTLQRTSHSANTSPAIFSHHSPIKQEAADDNMEQKSVPRHHHHSPHQKPSKSSKRDKKSLDNSSNIRRKHSGAGVGRTLSDIDRDIMEIYAKLPQIKPEDIIVMKHFKFDSDNETDIKTETIESKIETDSIRDTAIPIVNADTNDANDDDDGGDYEVFEYDEEYEELTDEEIEVSDIEEPECESIGDEENNDIDQLEHGDDDDDHDCVHQQPNEAFNGSRDDDVDDHREQHTSGDILFNNNCDNSSAMDVDRLSTPSSPSSGGDRHQSKSTATIAATRDDGDCDDSMQRQSLANCDSSSSSNNNNICDDYSNDAISTATSNITDSIKSTELQFNSPYFPEATYLVDIELLNSCTPDNPFLELEPPPSRVSYLPSRTELQQLQQQQQSNSNDAQKSASSNVKPSETKTDGEMIATTTPLTTTIVRIDSVTSDASESSNIDEPISAVSLKTVDQPPPQQQPSPPKRPSKEIEVKEEEEEEEEDKNDNEQDDDDEERREQDEDEKEEDEEEERKVEEDNEKNGKFEDVRAVDTSESVIVNQRQQRPQRRRRGRRRTKLVRVQVIKRKRRKCVGRYRVKRSMVDRVAGEQWEHVNGNYDKDGAWHNFGEMTSAYVLRGGANATNLTSEENVLHILPYVNYSW